MNLARHSLLAVVAIFVVLQPIPALTQAPPANNDAPQLLDTIVVTGTQVGPGMWYVTNGEHEMWILGSLSPLPAGIEWDASVVNDILPHTQEVIWGPHFIVDMKAGFFQKLYLGYRFSKAQKNPDGESLQDVLPPDLYARWAIAKQRYMPGDGDVERKRPLVAAEDLFAAALKRHGLVKRAVIRPRIEATLKEHNITSTVPKVLVMVADPKAALKEAQKLILNDTSCMEATLDAIDQDLPRMVTNANAWSTGDIGRISFAQIKRREDACTDAFSNNELSRRIGIPDVQASMKAEVMKSLESALGKNRTTVAILPLQDVLGADGFVADLRARGYRVEDPVPP